MILIWVFVIFLGKELGRELTVEEGDVMGDEGACARLAIPGSLAEWGLVAVPELVLLP